MDLHNNSFLRNYQRDRKASRASRNARTTCVVAYEVVCQVGTLFE